MFLCRNTASFSMFEPLLTLYENQLHMILMDFLGHGRSERREWFPADLWIEEARQTVVLLEDLDWVEKVVADSFDGRTL